MAHFPVGPPLELSADRCKLTILPMSDDARSIVMAKVRSALAATNERAAYPDYDPAVTVVAPRSGGASLLETFERNLKAVNGRSFHEPAALAAFLAENVHRHGYCDPACLPVLREAFAAATLEVETTFARERYDDYAFGITRGTAAIAESGTVVINDDATSDRLAALTPWVHVVVLRVDELIPTIAEAVQRFGKSPNIIWCTGPSKTADVEGILIEGVHGPGEQVVMFVG